MAWKSHSGVVFSRHVLVKRVSLKIDLELLVWPGFWLGLVKFLEQGLP